MNAAEWALELADTLAHSGHGLAQVTVASFRNAAGRDEIVETAVNITAIAGWPLCELSATSVDPDPSVLPEAGFVIVRDVDVPLPTAVPVLMGAFQHLVQRDLPVGLLVVGTTRGIRALRSHPAMGFLGRAESVIQT